MDVTPYLFFSGRCEEALEFYTKALGASVEMKMKFNESPMPPPPGMLQAGFENKIMHSSFTIEGKRIMASDGCDDRSKFDGFRLVWSVDSERRPMKSSILGRGRYSADAADFNVLVTMLWYGYRSVSSGMDGDGARPTRSIEIDHKISHWGLEWLEFESSFV